MNRKLNPKKAVSNLVVNLPNICEKWAEKHDLGEAVKILLDPIIDFLNYTENGLNEVKHLCDKQR